MSFFAMGGYAVYVWPAIGATLLILAWIAISSIRTLRQREQRLALLEDARARRKEGEAS